MTKAEIRERSRVRGIPTWDQPASPCLSSRIPYGTEVTAERLRLVERAEDALRELGIRGDLRVRLHGPVARVELSPAELDEWLGAERSVTLRGAVVGAGLERVALDLAGFRSGSLNALAPTNTPIETAPNVDTLESGLRSQGLPFTVTAHGSMAVVALPQQPEGGDHGRQRRPLVRAETVAALARECGFTHAALELHPPV